ncbi:uncharacterized protein LOC118418166 [Branchiostoma floridae]|uniref:Uncharacterized protein LOC118418166 n=1 Tax=Branchiostoma floridae TaxID=7739 RepID=A0A9J7MUZ9_BRAFL|nr:uncharacterized protein LOC118418166 [Branchiostoma floridae]
MRLLVVAALAAALALAESAALDKKAVVGEELLDELEKMVAAKVKEKEWPPLCVWDKSGCDISGFTKTLADQDDIAVSGYGLSIPDAIQLVGAHLDHETGQIDDVAALGADIAAAGSYHAGRMVGYEDAVTGVSAALGLEEKKSLPASKKNVEVAELLQKLREYVRDLNQK